MGRWRRRVREGCRSACVVGGDRCEELHGARCVIAFEVWVGLVWSQDEDFILMSGRDGDRSHTVLSAPTLSLQCPLIPQMILSVSVFKSLWRRMSTVPELIRGRVFTPVVSGAFCCLSSLFSVCLKTWSIKQANY